MARFGFLSVPVAFACAIAAARLGCLNLRKKRNAIVADPAVAAPQAGTGSEPTSPSGLRVLVLDDTHQSDDPEAPATRPQSPVQLQVRPLRRSSDTSSQVSTRSNVANTYLSEQRNVWAYLCELYENKPVIPYSSSSPACILQSRVDTPRQLSSKPSAIAQAADKAADVANTERLAILVREFSTLPRYCYAAPAEEEYCDAPSALVETTAIDFGNCTVYIK